LNEIKLTSLELQSYFSFILRHASILVHHYSTVHFGRASHVLHHLSLLHVLEAPKRTLVLLLFGVVSIFSYFLKLLHHRLLVYFGFLAGSRVGGSVHIIKVVNVRPRLSSRWWFTESRWFARSKLRWLLSMMGEGWL
jgi:hypothetical protein